MADLAAVVDTVVATVTTAAAALAVATQTETARVVGLIAQRALAVHVTVAHQTPKSR